MKPTDNTNGPDDETPYQKRERESRERLNKQYAEHHGFPVPGSEDVVDDLADNVTEQGGDTNESHFPRRVDLGLTRDDIHQRASDILRNNDAESDSDASDSGIIWLPSDSDSDIPVARPVGDPDSHPEFDYTASSSAGGNGGGGRDGNDDDGWTTDDSDDDDEINDDENFYSADNPDDTDDVDTIPFDDETSEDSDEFEDSEDREDDENDYHDDEDDLDDNEVRQSSRVQQPSPGIWARVTSFLRGNPDRRWGDSLPKWMKQPPMANAAGILTSLPIAKSVGNILLNGVAAGAPLATYIALPVASSGSLLVSAARTARGQDNAKRRQEEEPISDTDLAEIHQALSLNEGGDLIDTAEEQTAAQIVDRLGILKVKTFPLCGSDEEYAQEMYRRIHPVLSRGAHHDTYEEPELEHEGVPGGCPERWSEKKKEKIRKQLRSQKLYDAYVQLLADAHHGEEHAHDEGGDDHGHGKSLKALTESQIKQVSVQLGRMMYNRHLVQNHFGRAFGLAGAAVLGTMTGTIVPFAIAGGIEGGRELYRRYRVNKSHLRYDLKGNIVNTKDGKDILVLPPEKKIEEEHEDHVTEEQVQKLEKKKDSAVVKFEKAEKEYKDLETKIEESKITADRLQRYIDDIKYHAENRKLTIEQENEIKRLRNTLNALNTDIIDLESDRDTLNSQVRQLDIKIQEAEEEIGELMSLIRDIANEIGDNDPTERQRRKISEAKARIKEIGISSLESKKEGYVTQKKNITRKINDLERRKADLELDIEAILTKGNNKELTSDEKKKIIDYEKEIEALKISTMEIKLPGLKTLRDSAEKKLNSLEKNLEKTEEAFEKSKHHKKEEKEDGFWKKSTKFIFASNPVQTALNFTKDVAIHGTAGAVGGAVIGSFIGVPGWGATLVGGWVAGKYLVNRLTGAANNPHPKVDVHHDTAHGKKDDHGHAKKDDHKTDTHH